MSAHENRENAVRQAVVDIERHVARAGWDGPVAVFALVRTADAVERTPELTQDLPEEALAAATEDAEHLTSIEQDGLPASTDLEDLLAQLAWPESVDGAAVVVERIVVPPEAEAQISAQVSELPPQAAEAAKVDRLLVHPDRQDVRIAAGVLRTGESWCALRSRANDFDDAVAGAPAAVPGLVAALSATFA